MLLVSFSTAWLPVVTALSSSCKLNAPVDPFICDSLGPGWDFILGFCALSNSLSPYLTLYFSPAPEPACSWLVCHLMECSSPSRLSPAAVPSWKAPRHTHLARRLPLWSASPFVSTMLMKALSVSTVRTPGRLLMSSLFDRYRHPARCSFFLSFFFLSLVDDASLLSCMCMCVHRSVCVCVRTRVGLKRRETKRRGLVSWLGLFYNKREEGGCL